MEAINATRRRRQKHWQARLSCSNCMPKAVDCPSPEIELKSFIEGAYSPISAHKPELKSEAEQTIEEKKCPKRTEEKACQKKSDEKASPKKTEAAANAVPKDITDPCFPDGVLKEDNKMGGKEKSKKKVKAEKNPKAEKAAKLEKKASAKNKDSKAKDKNKKKQEPVKRFEPRKMKNNNPTFTQIGGSVNHNCCSCLEALGLYFKEFFRFSCSLTTGHPAQDTQFQERICDMLTILATMCRDCYYVVRYVLRLLFVE